MYGHPCLAAKGPLPHIFLRNPAKRIKTEKARRPLAGQPAKGHVRLQCVLTLAVAARFERLTAVWEGHPKQCR